MVEVCQFIPFEVLRKRLEVVQSYARYLKPDFLEELAESCEAEEG
jgi:hypothetical protein